MKISDTFCKLQYIYDVHIYTKKSKTQVTSSIYTIVQVGKVPEFSLNINHFLLTITKNSCDDCIDNRKRTPFLEIKVSMTKEIISGIGPADRGP
jgi:hypothetical protein